MARELYEHTAGGRKIIVEKLGELIYRTGVTIKRRSVRYRSLHDNEESARPVEEFERKFKKHEPHN